MKLILSLFFLIFIYSSSFAGFVIGYQGGKYIPGMANTNSTMYYYNKVYGAEFKYNNYFKGIFIGVRFDDKHGWFGVAWNKKQNTFTSNYTRDNIISTLSIRTKMNELVIDGGATFAGWGIGGGFNLANFDVLTKQAKLEEFGSAKWEHGYGKPIKLLGLPDYPGFCFIAERHFSNFIILRMTYHFGVGDISFAKDATLTFYDFKPKNLTLALLLNIGKNED
jgi:hypothetical protein